LPNLSFRLISSSSIQLHSQYCHVLDVSVYSALYIYKVRDYRKYSAIAIQHTFRFNVTHALGFSVFTSRILATDISQSHCNFKSYVKSSCRRLISFLAIILQLPIPKTRLNSLLYSLLFFFYCSILRCTSSRLLTVYFYKPSARTPRKTSSSIVNDALPSNGCAFVACVSFDGMCLQGRCLAMGIHVIIFYETP
jgi:hypothetical protein